MRIFPIAVLMFLASCSDSDHPKTEAKQSVPPNIPSASGVQATLLVFGASGASAASWVLTESGVPTASGVLTVPAASPGSGVAGPPTPEAADGADEMAGMKRVDEFIADGWGGDAIRGFEAIHDLKQFRQIGKVLKESVTLIKREDNPSVNDELHNYQYDGMSVSAYLARIDGVEKIMVNDVAITGNKWPVKFGLTVGTPKKVVEETLGKGFSSDTTPDELLYGDGGAEITFAFDANDKVKSVTWHMDGGAD